MVHGATLSLDQSLATPTQAMHMCGIPYTEVIGSVLWPVVVLRPDVAFAISLLSQFIKNPGPVHWEALKRVIVYMRSTKDLWLTFGGHSKLLAERYCDADGGGQKHHHSISGYSFHMGGGAILWSSRKQHIVMLSSTEAEYVAQTHVAKEALWLCSFIGEIRGACRESMSINCDNQGAITL